LTGGRGGDRAGEKDATGLQTPASKRGGRDGPERVLFLEVGDMQLTDSHRRYWQKNLNITAVLLSIWFVVTFVVSYFARDLSFNFFGWPFSFWMGAQGSLIIYCLIIWFYARYMGKLDIEHGVEESED
jgi:putative solute:sodium symporter small subunit